MARIHEHALTKLNISSNKGERFRRAEIFFIEAITPNEQTHRAARQSKLDLCRLNGRLNRRTGQLAATHRQLQRGALERKAMADAFAKSGRRHDQCLEESLQLQNRLRQLTHRALAAQEDERQKISRELQDEIAQTLLAINVRLLSLKQEARSKNRGLKNQIASTQRLVVKSAQSVRRFARELDIHQPA